MGAACISTTSHVVWRGRRRKEEDEQTDVGAPIDAPEDLPVEVLGGGKKKGKQKKVETVVDEELTAASWSRGSTERRWRRRSDV